MVRSQKTGDALRHPQLARLPITVTEIDVCSAVLIEFVAKVRAVRGKFPRGCLPLGVRDPRYVLAGDIKQRNVLETAFFIRGEQNLPSIARDGRASVRRLASVRRKVCGTP